MRVVRWFLPILTVAGVLALLVLVPGEWLSQAEARLAAWRGWLGAVRIAAIVAAWAWWDALVGRIPGITPAGAAWLRRRRTFWIGALAAIELVVVRNLPRALWELTT